MHAKRNVLNKVMMQEIIRQLPHQLLVNCDVRLEMEIKVASYSTDKITVTTLFSGLLGIVMIWQSCNVDPQTLH